MNTLLTCAVACILLAGMPLMALAGENNTTVAKAIPAVVTIVTDLSLTGYHKLRIDPISAVPGGRPIVILQGAPAPLKVNSVASDTRKLSGCDY
jgi:hypothetical protein